MKTLQSKQQPRPQASFFNGIALLLITVFMMLSLGLSPSLLFAASKEDSKENAARIEKILSQYREPHKSQLRQAIRLTSQRYSGQVLNASIQSSSDEKRFQIKMLLNNGYMKTYYVDKDLHQISQ